MAITVPQGIMSSVDDTSLPQLFADQGAIGGPSGVATGLVVTIGTGTTRPVSIGAGRAVCGGATFTNSAASTLNLAQNTSGVSRTDVVCAQVDWVAARTAFASAGGVANLAAASAAAQAAAGSFVAIPLGSTPIQNPGTKWQEPLAQQVVPAGATQLSGGLTDVRNLANRSATVTFPGTFTAATDGTPLKVTRTGGLVTFGGHVNRGNTNLGSTSAGDDTSASWGTQVIIPQGFWPNRVIDIPVRSGGGGPSTAMPTNWLQINPDGSALLTAGIGNPITAGSLIRIATTTWKAA